MARTQLYIAVPIFIPVSPSGRQEMDAMSVFTEIVLVSHLRKMDFREIPKTLRARIVDNFGTFDNLRSLIIGSAGGEIMQKKKSKMSQP